MKSNIVLIGLMGCGKSSLGRLLAKRFSMEFVDMDTVIEKEANMTITEMFDRYGEAYFRDRETQLCHRLSQSRGLVISTGGGVIQREENMKALGENGLVVFIDRRPQAIIHSVNCANRPLLKKDPRQLFVLYEKRLPLYRTYADVTFKNRGSLKSAILRLTQLLSDYAPADSADKRRPTNGQTTAKHDQIDTNR